MSSRNYFLYIAPYISKELELFLNTQDNVNGAQNTNMRNDIELMLLMLTSYHLFHRYLNTTADGKNVNGK